MHKRLVSIIIAMSLIASLLIIGCQSGEFTDVYDRTYEELAIDPLIGTWKLNTLGDHPDDWNFWEEMVPREGGAIELSDIKVTPSIALKAGESIHILLNSNTTIYYPGVSKEWEHALNVNVAYCIRQTADETQIWYPDSTSHNGIDIKYSYASTMDRDIELVIQNNDDQLKVYRLMIRSNDSRTAYRVKYSITAMYNTL